MSCVSVFFHQGTHTYNLRITAEQADVQAAVDTKTVLTTLSFKPSQAAASGWKSSEIKHNNN